MYTPEQIAEMVAERAKNEVGYVGDNGVNAKVPYKTNKFFKVLDSIKGFYNTKKNGYDWCAGFVDAVQLTVLGEDVMKKITFHTDCGAGVGFAYRQYEAKKRIYKTPKVGDEVFYYKVATHTWQHTGMVVEVTGNRFTTVEGNCSNSVKTYTKVLGQDTKYVEYFGRPDWNTASSLVNKTETEKELISQIEPLIADIETAAGKIGEIIKEIAKK